MNLQQRVSQLGNPSDPSNQIHLEDVQRTHVGKRRWVQRIVKIVLAVHFWQTTLMIAPVYAQTAPATRQTANVAPLLTRATNAPTGQKPIIDAAPNGVPIVLIAPPSLGGVSRNQYNDFNVGQRGLILNNSKGEVNTQLGGIVSGNLQLGKVQARIILNEVTSTNPSQLNGFIEVAGQRADIVIANPNGITCDGCGFLNTAGRVTLTTGTSQFDNGGNLDSLSVQRGLVTVGAGGLNAADINQLDLLARGIVIEGEILTQNLQAVLGANKVLYGTLKATAQDGGAAANAPKFAVDIVELGGLFANQVYLIATDKGLGVNSRGRIAALEGNITLNAQGDVNLHDNYSKNDINLNAAGSVSLSGQTGADNNVVITAPTQITNSQTATLRAGQQVLLNTNKLDNGGSIIQSGANHAFNLTVPDAIDNRGLIYSANDLTLQSQAIGGIGGTLLAENGLSVRAGGINFTGQQVFANQDIKLDASTIAIKKSVLHANAVNLNGAQSIFSDGSEVSAVQDVRLASDAAGGQISVQNSTIIGGAQIALGAADVGFTASKLSAGTGLSIDGNQVQVQQSQLLAQQQLALTSQTALNLDGSNVTSQGSVQLQGQGISTQAALIAADQVQVQAGNGKLDNRAGTVYANRRLDVAAIGVDNGGGRIGSQGELVLDAQGGVVDNNNGLITASNSVLRNVSGILNRNGSIYTTNDFALTGVIDNHLGKLLTDGALILNSSTIDNSGGVLQARNTIQLNGDVLNNSAGVIQSTAGGIKLQSGSLDNNGAAIAAGAGIDLQTTSLQNQNGSISANGDASITATNIASNAGAIGAGGTLSVKGSALDFSSARLGSNGALTLAGDNINADHAQVQSGATVSLTSNSLSANSAQLLATKEANLDIAGDASLNKANIGAGSNLTLTSRTLNAAELQASSNKTLTITAQDVNLQQAQIVGLNGVDLHADDLNLSGAKASSGVDLTVRAKQQTGGDLSAQGNLNVQLQNGLNLSGGALTAGQSLTVTAQGITTDQARVNGNQIILDAGNQALHNQGGQIVAQGVGNSGLEVRAVGIDNRGGSLRSGSDVLLDTKGEALDSSAGNIVAGRDLHISASNLKNTGGSLGVAGNAQIDAATVDNSNGSINIIGNAQINATTLNNRSGSFSIGNSISLIGQEIDNTQGQLQSGTNINIDTLGKSLVNDGGLIQAQGQLTLAAGRLSNASGNFAANRDVSISAQTLGNNNGRILAGNSLDIRVAGTADSVQSTLLSGDALTFSAQNLKAGQSLINANGALKLTAGETLDLGQSDVQSGTSIALAAKQLVANSVKLVSNGAVEAIAASDISLNDAQLNALGNVNLVAQNNLDLQRANVVSDAQLGLGAAAINAEGANLSSTGNASLNASKGLLALNNVKLASNGALQLTGNGVNAANAVFSTKNNISIDTQGADYNANGSVHGSQSGIIDVQAKNLHAAGSGSTAQGFLAAGDITLRASGLIDVSGAVVSSGANIALTAQDSLNNNAGQVVAAGTANLNAASLNNAGGVIDANGALRITANQGGIDSKNGSISTRDQLTLETVSGLNRKAGQIDVAGAPVELNNDDGHIVGLRGVDVASGSITNRNGSIASGVDLALALGNTNFSGNGGALLAQGGLSLNARTIDVSLGQVQAGSNIGIKGGSLQAQGSTISTNGGDLVIDTANGAFDANQSRLLSFGTLNVKAGATNLAQSIISSGANTNLQTGALDAHQAQIDVGGDLTIGSTGGINTQAANVAVNGKLNLAATSLLGGQYRALKDINVITSGSTNLSNGTLITDKALNVQAQGITLDQSSVIGSQVVLNAGNSALSNRQGVILATESNASADILRINSQGLINSGGTISSNGNLTITAGSGKLDGADAVISAAGRLSISAGDINNQRSLVKADQSISIASQAFDNQAGNVQAGKALTINATNIDSRSGTLLGVDSLNLTGAHLNSSDNARIVSNGDINLTVSGLNNDTSQISAGGNLTVSASGSASGSVSDSGAISSRNAVLEAGGKITLNSAANIDNNNGKIEAGTQATLTALSAFNNNAGRIVSNGALSISAAALDNQAALISSGGNLRIDSKTLGGAINNQQGQIQANGTADILAQGINNQSATIIAAQDVVIDAGTGLLDNRQGALQSTSQSLRIAAGDINNAGTASTIVAGKNLGIVSQNGINNQQAWISAGGGLTVSANGIINNSAQGRIGAGSDIAITTQGAINNAQGIISAAGNTSVQGVGINNSNAQISTGNALHLQAGNGVLDNSGGSLAAGGILTANAGRISNQSGVVNANGSITLQGDASGIGGSAAAFDNSAGLISSAQGSVSIRSGDFYNQRAVLSNAASNGQINAAQDISINANGSIDNSNSAISVAGHLDINASGSINNSNARLVGLIGLNLNVNGINSSNGLIASNGALSLGAGAGAISNENGQITGGGQTSINGAGSFNNRNGVIETNSNLAIGSGNFDNSFGRLSAQGSIGINSRQFDNLQGNVIGEQALSFNTNGNTFNNTGGTFGSNGDITLLSGHAILSGSNIASGKSLYIAGNQIDADHSNFSANQNISILAGNGVSDLNLNQSKVEAGQAINLDGKIINLGQSTVAANAAISINGTDIDSSNSNIRTQNNLGIIASNNLLIDGATYNAGHDLSIGSNRAFIFNTAGFNFQFGNDLTVRANGINNVGGNLTGHRLTLDAGGGVLNNQGGSLSATDGLTLAGNGLNNSNATIAANGQVTINAGTGQLDNSNGVIGSIHDAVTIQSGDLLNNGSSISAATQLNINAAALSNRAGQLQAGNGVAISASSIDNSQGGVIAGTGNVSASASNGNLNNQNGIIQSSTGAVTVSALAGLLDNSNGQIYGAQAATLSASSLRNNSNGRIGSNGASSVSATQIDNRGGLISASSTATVAGNDINNAGGVISGLNAVSVTGRFGASASLVNNDAGVIEAGQGGIRIATATLTNNNSGTTRGIVSEGNIDINAASLIQNNGAIGANRTLTISSTNIDNTNGSTLLGLGGVTLTANAGLNNQGGSVQSGNNLNINGGSINNNGGSIFATQNLNLSATNIDNRNTLSGAYNKGLLSGGSATINATSINNDSGAVVALGDLSASSTGAVSNIGGRFAGDRLTLAATSFTNSAGRVDATSRLTTRANSFSADGVLASGGAIDLILGGDYTNTGLVASNGDLNITLNNGAYTNNGTVSAARNLQLSATSLSNNGSISANTTNINVGTLYNNASGVINAVGATNINVGSTNNAGRIYGNTISIGGSVNNNANATIASRGDLSISGALLNNPGANILAIGNANLGSVTNAGATIEAGGSLTIGSLNNLNCTSGSGGNGAGASNCAAYGLQGGVALQTQTKTENVLNFTITPAGSTREYHPIELGSRIEQGVSVYYYLGNNISIEDYTQKNISTITTVESVISSSNPGRVSAGGNITIGSGNNVDSQIVAGGNIVFGNAAQVGDGAIRSEFDTTNISTKGSRQITEVGTSFFTTVENSCSLFGGCHHVRAYQPTQAFSNIVNSQENVDGVLYKTGASVSAPSSAPAASIDAAPTVQRVSAIGVSATAQNHGITGSVSAPSVGSGQGVVVTTGGAVVVAGSAPTVSNVQAGTVNSAPVAGAGTSVVTSVVTRNADAISNQSTSTLGQTATTATGQTSNNTNNAVISNANQVQVSSDAVEQALPGSVIAGGVRATQQVVINSVTTQFSTLAQVAALRPIAPQQQQYQAAANNAALQSIRQDGINAPGAAPKVTLTTNTQLRAPSGNLFSLHPNDGARYLVETDPLFTNGQNYLGSDYFLTQLNLDPGRSLKRYGDGFVEQRVFADQLISLTGRNSLSGYADNQQAFQALMDAGVAYARTYQLTPGVALTEQQMALLTTDIVWLEEQNVTLPDGSSTRALVPQVYLRRPQQGDLTANGALIAGDNVTIRNQDGTITNSGSILAGYGNANDGQQQGQLVLDARNIQTSGTLAGNAIGLNAGQDINLQGGRIIGLNSGNSGNTSGNTTGQANNSLIQLTAGRDITIASTTASAATATLGNNGISTSSRTNIDRIATIAGGNIQIAAAGNVTGRAAQINASNDLTILAGNNIDIASVAVGSTLAIPTGGNTQGKSGFIKQTELSNVASNLSAGNNLTLIAQGDTSITGSNLAALKDATIVGANVNLSAALDRQIADVQSASRNNYNHALQDNQAASGGQINAAGQLTILANGSGNNGNINLLGAGLASGKGDTTLIATKDINIAGLVTQHSSQDESYSKSSSLLKSASYSSSASSSASQTVGSSISGPNILIQSGRDTSISGSTIVADANISIDAARNLAITASTDSYSQQNTSRSKTSGLLGSVLQPAFGVVKQNQTGQQNGLTLNSSQIASLGSNGSGNISLSAAETLTQSASNILTQASAAGQGNITLAAQNINITSAAQLADSQQHSQYSKVAFGGSISTPLLSAVQSLGTIAGALNNTSDSRLQTLAAINTALTVKSAADSASALANGDLTGLKVSLSLGSSKTQSTSHESSSTAIGSSLNAGGNLALIASNSSNSNNPNDPSKGNLNITGSSLSAGNNTLLHADHSLTLQAAQNTSTLESSNKSSGSSIGIGFAIGGSQNGFTLDASANRASGRANGTDTTHLNTQVTAGNNLSLSSGADTSLKGATVSAHSVTANIGGDLNLVSQQDSSQYTSKQTSSGLGVSLCLPPYCYGNSSATGSYGKSKINGDYQSVSTQSGIQAGDGGFAIKVGGNTDLQGAVIASTQKAVDDGNNSLTTGSLTQSDLQNKDTYRASGFAVSASVSSKVGDQTNAGNNSNLSDAANQRNASAANSKDTPGASAGIGSQSGSQSSTTLSGISAGTITITNDARQIELTGKDGKATVAGLATGITTDSNTSGALTKAWNEKQLQKQVDAQISITQTFSQIAPKAVGDYASKQFDSLKAQAEQENDPIKAAELQAEAKKWDEGGAYRIALHTVTGALSGGLSGAAGAATAAGAAPLLQSLQTATEQALTEQGLGSSAVKAIAQGLAEATALGLGAAVGGSSGAVSSLVVDTNNRQLHPDERKWAKENVDKYRFFLAEKTGEKISAEEAYQRLLSAGYAITDDYASKAGKSDETAKQFISGNAPRTLFSATAQERNSPLLGGNLDGSYTPEQQARWGSKTPGENASKLVTTAYEYLGKPCGTDCGNKFDAINNAVVGLQQARLLYQDDQGSVALIDKQIGLLTDGISKDEVARGAAQTIGAKDKDIAALLLGGSSKLITGKATANLLDGVVGANTAVDVGFDTANVQSKLGYLLDAAHPQNQTKATWFQQALGFDKSNWQDLALQLRFNEAIAIQTKVTQYGTTFEQSIPIVGANGNTINTTFVFMKDPNGVVRLVTGIPTKK